MTATRQVEVHVQLTDWGLSGMKRLVLVTAGLFVAGWCAFPQAYTISAKPGAVNFIEGTVLLDGQPLTSSELKSTFVNAGGLLETRDGRAELLLTPGVFLRVGERSQVRMLKASLVDSQIAIEAGESMLEVDDVVRDSRLTVSMRGGLAEIQKAGLYRFAADGEASVAVIDGKAEVTFGEKHESLGKGREVLLNDGLKTKKFDKDQADELYAWSNIRSQYNASLTYQAARSAYSSGTGSGSGYGYGGGLGYGSGFGGFNGFYGPGWYWSNGFNSWLWMPSNGAFFSPFGWGFYGPAYAAYAPVVVVPVRSGGGGAVAGGIPVTHPHPGSGNGTVVVPVNPKSLPAVGVYTASPGQYAAARMQTARMVSASGGLPTASGNRVQPGTSFSTSARGSAGSGSSSGNVGGSSASHSSGGMSSASHSGGGGSSSGGHNK
jgi:hypothetical protein